MSKSSGTASRLDVGVLIAAAGKGERAGSGVRKQYRPIRGVPMLLRSIRPFARHPRVREIVVALPPSDLETPPDWLASVAGSRLRLVAGGETRAESVQAALAVLDRECGIVLVHDAARPFVAQETVDAVIAKATTGIGALPVVPVTDTLKRTESGSARVVETVDRELLWRAQTPQGFPRAVIEAAYRQADAGEIQSFTDEASLAEAAGYAVEIVGGSDRNIKVTTEADFSLAELLADR
jgi:2-C-methyl-D-erythritol 4-phosphate cytidylyltransferase